MIFFNMTIHGGAICMYILYNYEILNHLSYSTLDIFLFSSQILRFIFPDVSGFDRDKGVLGCHKRKIKRSKSLEESILYDDMEK